MLAHLMGAELQTRCLLAGYMSKSSHAALGLIGKLTRDEK